MEIRLTFLIFKIIFVRQTEDTYNQRRTIFHQPIVPFTDRMYGNAFRTFHLYRLLFTCEEITGLQKGTAWFYCNERVFTDSKPPSTRSLRILFKVSNHINDPQFNLQPQLEQQSFKALSQGFQIGIRKSRLANSEPSYMRSRS